MTLRLRARLLALAALAGSLAATGSAAQSPRFPFPQHVPGPYGSILPAHRTQAALDQEVAAAYDRWKTRHLIAAGTEADGHPRYRVRHTAGPTSGTVSEGQGYGMLIVVHFAGHDAAARPIFDGLVEYRRDHPSGIDGRLMDWFVPSDEASDPPDDSAFDGDADIALALLAADRQWGSGGRIDYFAEALTVIDGIRSSTIGPASRLPMLGDWVDPVGTAYNQRTVRPSDFLPGHFRAFARATGDPVWNATIAAVQDTARTLRENFAPATGLLPDFTVPTSAADSSPKPAPADFLEGPHDGKYYYNAGRVPWRFATDALLTGDPSSRATARAIALWAKNATAGNPLLFRAGYGLDGVALPDSDYFSTFFVAPLGAAARLDPANAAWLAAIFDAVKSAEQGYYEDSVTLLSLLVMSGNFWSPDRAGMLFFDGFESSGTQAWTGG